MAVTEAAAARTSAIEDVLARNREQGYTLATMADNQDAMVRHAWAGKLTGAILRRMLALEQMLAAEVRIAFVQTGEDLQQMTRVLAGAKRLGLDLETMKKARHPLAGLLPVVSAVRLVQLFDGSTCYVVDAGRLGLEWMQALRHIPMIAHNAQFEDGHLSHAGVRLERLDCTLLMARVFLGEHGLALDTLVQKAFGVELDKTLQVSNWGRSELLPEQVAYAAADAVFAVRLADRFEAWFTQQPHYRDTYRFLQELIRPTTDQMLTGVCVDPQAHADVVASWQQQLDTATTILSEYGLSSEAKPKGKPTKKGEPEAGDAPKYISRPADRQWLLRKYLTEAELERWPRTDTGGLKTDGDSLAALAGGDNSRPQLAALGQWAEASSRLANYGPKVAALSVGGKVFPQYRIAGMVSGRFGCNEPNIQNQPREGFKHIYVSPEGWVFVASDLSQVELRVGGLISQDEVIMGAYARGEDLHLSMGTSMLERMDAEAREAKLAEYGGDEAALLKAMRQGAKGCIAEGSMVLTDNGMKPIEDVLLTDRVWDGIEWVTHEGVVFQGIKEVTEYDGLKATPDHQVWTEEQGKVQLGHAASQHLRLTRTGDSAGRAITVRDEGFGVGHSEKGERLSDDGPSLRSVRHHPDHLRGRTAGWDLEVVPMPEKCEVPASRGGDDSRGALRRDDPAMPQADSREQPELPRQRDRGQVRVTGALHQVGSEHVAWGDLQGEGPGPHRQQRPLRAGKPSASDTLPEPEESTHHQDDGNRRSTDSCMRRVARVEGAAPWTDAVVEDSDQTRIGGSQCGVHTEPTTQTKKVYDIVNAGPRHRFTVSGRLVANCNFGLIFGGSAAGLQAFAKTTYGVEFTLEEAIEFKDVFHRRYPGLTEWQRLIVKHSRQHAEVESPYSRLTRHFSEGDYFRKGSVHQGDPYSVAMNHPIQSGAFEILAIAIKHIHANSDPSTIRISHSVYDELVLIAREDVKEQAAQLLYDGFATGYRTVFPGCSVASICEVGWGRTWADTGKKDNLLPVKEWSI